MLIEKLSLALSGAISSSLQFQNREPNHYPSQIWCLICMRPNIVWCHGSPSCSCSFHATDPAAESFPLSSSPPMFQQDNCALMLSQFYTVHSSPHDSAAKADNSKYLDMSPSLCWCTAYDRLLAYCMWTVCNYRRSPKQRQHRKSCCRRCTSFWCIFRSIRMQLFDTPRPLEWDTRGI